MKKLKILVAAILIGGGVYFTSNQLSASINPCCPNGCVVGNASGCYCYGEYPQYSEYDWSKFDDVH